MKHPKNPCPVCALAISNQGLTAHLRYKHPNYDAASSRRPPTSVAFQDLERWKEGFVEGVLAGMRNAG